MTMSIHFLDLPPEILILILCHLDLPTLTSCLATNRRVKSIIDGSTLLQYRLAAQAACVEDNPWNLKLDSAHKLAALRKRQAAFAESFSTHICHTIELDDPFDCYALSGSIFVMTERNSKTLRWCSLTTNQPVFQTLKFSESIWFISLALPEEDLMVVILTLKFMSDALQNQDGTPNVTVKLCFYELSTQSAHRMAREPVLHLSIPEDPEPDFHVDICDSRVVLLIDYNDAKNRVLVYDWKQGRLLMEFPGGYLTPTFLSLDVMLLTQKGTGALELWTIQDSAPVAGPDIFLKLPQLATTGNYYAITKVEAIPKGHASSSSHSPFHTSFVDSIVALDVYVQVAGDVPVKMLLVISRRALLQLLPSAKERGNELWWREWGPSNAHWLNHWPTITCGTRFASVELQPLGCRLRLFDFNPLAYKQLAGRGALANTAMSVLSGTQNRARDIAGLFDEELGSQLGYLVLESDKNVYYDGVLLDDEWIVGIKESLDGHISLDLRRLGDPLTYLSGVHA
ncbi:hypothetical protein B0H16DRAFT_1771158 [Mycena metata]|uniref:F-box domain-containing protein n=1 Tax=Mycena metata TaxID=1033252 RepID=A0AAD7JTN2_9AGAR|nr:hypothetical protein B0H16DRAFT_1771158 [Mycena metata]